MFLEFSQRTVACVHWAKENNVELINADHMKSINDKRAKEKAKK